MTIHKRIAMAYKVPRITKLIDEDLKLIKKLNTVLTKLEKTNKDQYMLESINIIRTLGNVFEYRDLYILLYELIEIRYHSTVNYLIDIIETNFSDEFQRLKIIKKLRELADEEA